MLLCDFAVILLKKIKQEFIRAGIAKLCQKLLILWDSCSRMVNKPCLSAV